MIEKEAEEYVPNIKWHDFSSEDLREEMKLCYRAGMKDGYQEGLKAKINATTISDCPHKDEWHYPSKGEYPTTEEEVLVYLWDSFYIGTYCLDSSEINRWHFNDFEEQSDQITAWRYIEPPKEEE